MAGERPILPSGNYLPKGWPVEGDWLQEPKTFFRPDGVLTDFFGIWLKTVAFEAFLQACLANFAQNKGFWSHWGAMLNVFGFPFRRFAWAILSLSQAKLNLLGDISDILLKTNAFECLASRLSHFEHF